MNNSILLVDDDQRLRELLRDYLSEKNYSKRFKGFFKKITKFNSK